MFVNFYLFKSGDTLSFLYLIFRSFSFLFKYMFSLYFLYFYFEQYSQFTRFFRASLGAPILRAQRIWPIEALSLAIQARHQQTGSGWSWVCKRNNGIGGQAKREANPFDARLCVDIWGKGVCMFDFSNVCFRLVKSSVCQKELLSQDIQEFAF